MTDFYDFSPDPGRAEQLDARMHAGLADSLEHICERAAGLDGLDVDGIESVTDGIRSGHRYAPFAFGRYYELALDLLADRLEEAARASSCFSGLVPAVGDLQVDSIGNARLGEDTGLIHRRIGGDAADRFLTPPPEMADPFIDRLLRGIDFLDRLLPDLAGEFHAITRNVVLATGPVEYETNFDGASIYQLWGLLLLNPRYNEAPVEIVETLAHESAHSLLFGFSYDEALVLNDDEDLFSSPLRRDPRPMDGVYHATFVTARMHWAMAQLAACKDLDAAARDQAAKAAERDAASFKDGFETVRQHADLTETGQALLRAAQGYMEAAA